MRQRFQNFGGSLNSQKKQSVFYSTFLASSWSQKWLENNRTELRKVQEPKRLGMKIKKSSNRICIFKPLPDSNIPTNSSEKPIPLVKPLQSLASPPQMKPKLFQCISNLHSMMKVWLGLIYLLCLCQYHSSTHPMWGSPQIERRFVCSAVTQFINQWIFVHLKY